MSETAETPKNANPEEPDAGLPVPETLPDRGYRYVTTPEELAECVADLEGTTVLAADIEGDSFFSYREKTSLLQMTGDSGMDWVVDPLALPDLEPLRAVMEDRSVVKIFHGADYDVVSLKRDHGFQIGPIFDTMISAQATGHDRFGLSDLVKRYFGDTLQKKYQRHDWSRRPLLKEHLEYARLDSHYLPRLREILLEQAEAGGRLEMMAEEFELLEAREWTGRPFDPDDCLKVKGSNKLDEAQQRVLRKLYVVRDGLAERKNRPAFKVWGNDALLRLSREQPLTKSDLTDLLGPKNHILRRYADQVLEAIKEGREDTSRIPGKKAVEPNTRNLEVPPYLREDEPLFTFLKRWRNNRAKQAVLSPSMIVNNTVLKHIAALKPSDVGELTKIDDMRNWQRKQFGEELVARVAAFKAMAPPAGEDGEAGGRRRRGRRRRKDGDDTSEGAAASSESPPDGESEPQAEAAPKAAKKPRAPRVAKPKSRPSDV